MKGFNLVVRMVALGVLMALANAVQAVVFVSLRSGSGCAARPVQ